ncbi:hypothetical protein CLOM_g23501 [Closterium sp. NIES-68]|nr:hypothetical protein CLOM_g23501 [Closterium sp. NIES-68]GJP75735.1 hypothetical protein CLOP_g6142 [Closterium sp. NIES-67]
MQELKDGAVEFGFVSPPAAAATAASAAHRAAGAGRAGAVGDEHGGRRAAYAAPAGLQSAWCGVPGAACLVRCAWCGVPGAVRELGGQYVVQGNFVVISADSWGDWEHNGVDLAVGARPVDRVTYMAASCGTLLAH